MIGLILSNQRCRSLELPAMTYTLPRDFRIHTAQLTTAATGLVRPECVLATQDGRLHSADWRGRVAISHPRSAQSELVVGRIFALSKSGEITPVIDTIEGEAVPPSNVVIEDAEGRIWFTVSTRLGPGNFADGLCFDSQGGLWVTCIVGNRMVVVRPDGELQLGDSIRSFRAPLARQAPVHWNLTT
jgi:hypothetical protein